jgi:hypothetical protein
MVPMQIYPMHSKETALKPKSLDLLEDIEPEFGNRKAKRMAFTAENHNSLSMNHKVVLIICDL